MKHPSRSPWAKIVSLCLALSVLIAPWAGAEGDAAAGKSLFPVCTACHGPTGQGNPAMNAPKLAGVQDWYFIKQMQLFQKGARGTAAGDMTGMQMASMAKGPQLSSEQALQDMAAYIDTLPDTPITPTVTGDAEAGSKLYPICATCHGKQAEGMEQMGGPRLAGQSDWYLVSQIKKFKQGQRGYHNEDHGGRQMRPMVGTLTDDKSINDVVAYINSLQSE